MVQVSVVSLAACHTDRDLDCKNLNNPTMHGGDKKQEESEILFCINVYVHNIYIFILFFIKLAIAYPGTLHAKLLV